MISVIMIQSAFRRYLALCSYFFLRLPPEERSRMDVAARKIQLAFFVWKMRLAVDEVQSSAIILKRCMRGHLARSAARFALTHMNASFQRSAVVASAVWFMTEEDTKAAGVLSEWDSSVLLAKASASILIQSAARRMITRSQIRRVHGKIFGYLFLSRQRRSIRKERAAAKIQRCFRVWKNLISQREDSSTQIQRVYRGWIARLNYSVLLMNFAEERMEASALSIQRIQRGWKWRNLFLRSKNAAIRIQQCWRSYVSERDFETMRRAAIRIQSSTRRYLMSCQQERNHISVSAIQRCYRGWKWRHQLRTNRAATQLQSIWRSYVAQEHFRAARSAAVCVQCLARTHISWIRVARLQLATSKKSKSVAEDVLVRVTARSEARMGVIQDSRGEDGPCLSRLVDRVISTLHEAAIAAANTDEGAEYVKKIPPTTDSEANNSIETAYSFVSVENEVMAVGESALTPVTSNGRSLAFARTSPSAQDNASSLDHPEGGHQEQGKGNGGFWSSVLGATVSAGAASTGSLFKDLSSRAVETEQKPVFGSLKYRPTSSEQDPKVDKTDAEIFRAGEDLPSPIRATKKEDWDWAGEW